MKTLIAYCSNHGCTGKTAIELKENLGHEVELCNLKKDNVPNLNEFDRIIIGGSIHAGKIQKKISHFCNKNIQQLLGKEIGLFICCMEEGKSAQRELETAFPKELFDSAKASAYFGGEFNLQKMNFIEKAIVKKVANIEESISKIDHLAILKFSERMNRIFNPFLFIA
ncbi:MAG: flavodoxin domain-containing protein [Prolixibacteraceae bacterium]|nr:flavodoxin domain-containing protein [Prolixibacteraceae bacterium]